MQRAASSHRTAGSHRAGAKGLIERFRRAAPGLAATLLAGALHAQQLASPYDPTWAAAQPVQVIALDHDPALTDAENGDRLHAVIQDLEPGQRLEIGAGTWELTKLFNVDLNGTAQAPIWIVAQPGPRPLLLRPNNWNDMINVGMLNKGGPSSYLCFRGLELTGGSNGIRLLAASHIWIDDCYVHDVDGAGIIANTDDTAYIHITRNEIHGTGGYGEGMYLGANNAKVIMRESVVAENHVHDTGGWHGDGIELKQGSWGNWVVDNVVHDTNYPCLLVYGTGGMPVNIVEGNVLYDSNDNVLQVQGEAVVFDNLMMNGKVAFESHDHQGLTRDLVFAHNTVINSGRAVYLGDWKNRPGMVFANNAVYSELAESLMFAGNSNGVTVGGNVTFGPVVGTATGFTPGNGLADFYDVSWDATARDAVPAPGSALIGAGDPVYAAQLDLNRAARDAVLDAGCFEQGSWGKHYGAGLPGAGSGAPEVSLSAHPAVGDGSFSVRLDGARPDSLALLIVGVEREEIPFLGGFLLNDIAWFAVDATDASGSVERALPIPPDASLADVALCFQWIVQDPDAPLGLAFSDGLEDLIQQ